MWIICLALSALLAIALRFVAGSGGIDLGGVAKFIDLRATAAIAAASIGAALAVAGVLLQAILRNPLASPYVLGLTSGAGLAVTVSALIAYWLTGELVLYRYPTVPAVIGSLGAVLAVYTLSKRRGIIDPTTLILVGVIITIVCGSLMVFAQSLLSDAGLVGSVRWMMGSISQDLSLARVSVIAAATLAGVLLAARMGRALDAASLSDDEAVSVGVDLRKLRLGALGLAAFLTALTVVLAGPIGFVGLVCPHFARLLVGPSHRRLIVASALLGVALLVGADALTMMLTLPSGRLPLGVITSLVGGPVFIVLLIRDRGRMR
jgi:iron complex transport system permease protein